ncbi:acyltransferase [Rhodopseudomonas sp. BR0C11]|uniref:acyltransferase family protein n=1 Tax=Rhodopseudomonas sp. BR0C11 TaxID=2269370 RepID=UPI0013DFD7D9|nr:acyltransferase [Rhodopseudomonas sp. BR0C11]NEV75641.1 acyltransferase [Rhodopseudomonas sp. BR0C11]
MNQSRNRSLDQLRALAIIPVMTHHFYSPWLPGGGLGVIVFFVLSGYLIGQSLQNDSGGRWALTTKFVIRRALRIMPMYYVAVASAIAALALWSAPHLQLTLEILPQLLTMTRKPYSPPGYSFEVMWSLYVEVAFYLIIALSVLVFGLKRITTPAFLLIATAATFLLTSYPYTLLGCMFIGLSLHSAPVSSIKLKYPTVVGAACISIVTCFYFAVDVARPVDSNLFFLVEYITAAATGFLVLAVLQGAKIPLVPGAPYIGRISYSLYLVHAQVLDCLNTPSIIAPANVEPWFYPALCLAIASITYFIVERPYNRYAHSLCAKLDDIVYRAKLLRRSFSSANSLSLGNTARTVTGQRTA